MAPKDLSYNGYVSVLLRYPSAYGDGPGEPALWVQDDYLSGDSDSPGTYCLIDDNERVPLTADEDLDEIVAEWKRAVQWDDGAYVAHD